MGALPNMLANIRLMGLELAAALAAVLGGAGSGLVSSAWQQAAHTGMSHWSAHMDACGAVHVTHVQRPHAPVHKLLEVDSMRRCRYMLHP